MLSKITDAASMLWLNLDERERRLLVLVGVWLAGAVALAVSADAERRREERLLQRLEERTAHRGG